MVVVRSSQSTSAKSTAVRALRVEMTRKAEAAEVQTLQAKLQEATAALEENFQELQKVRKLW